MTNRSQNIVRISRRNYRRRIRPEIHWRRPNRPGRMNGLFPDTPAKAEADAAGRAYFPARPAAEPEKK